MKKKKNSFDKFIHNINIVWFILTVLALGAVYIPPSQLTYISLTALGIPFFIIINIIFVCYWLIKMKRYFLTSAIALFLSYNHIEGLYKIEKKDIALNTDLKVLSYNVHMFSDNKWVDTIQTEFKNIEDFVKQKSPDVICFQEYNHHLHKKMDYRYIYKNYNANRNLGQAIFSKYRIINKGSVAFPGTGNNAIFVDLIYKKKKIRIYNVHLQSLNLDTKKENFGLKNQKIIDRIDLIFKRQSEQVALMKNHMAECEDPIIIMGDFNNTAFSYNYRSLKEERKDAFKEAGIGFGETYKYQIPLRIDHILVDKSFEVHQFNTYKLPYSDHYPIMARLHI